jgi:hypothetical protein
MNKLISWAVLIIGVLFLLPLVGVDALGSLTDGVVAWAIGIIILLIGLAGVVGKA